MWNINKTNLKIYSQVENLVNADKFTGGVAGAPFFFGFWFFCFLVGIVVKAI